MKKGILLFISILTIIFSAFLSYGVSAASPYPKSPVITGIAFDQSTWVKAAPGSDQFGYTTASDGNIYVAWGDGGGFEGTNSLGRSSLGVGRIEGTPPSWTPYNVWGGVDPESSQPSTLGKTSNGVIAVNGAIYLYVDEQDVWTNNNLWKSTDLGMTWTDLGQMFNEAHSAFAEPGILQFGPNYQGARDNYIYGYSPDELADSLTMFRVDKSHIENRASYQFYAGLDSSGNPVWTSDITKEKPVFTDPAGTEWGTTATYDPYLDRYLLSVRHNGESGEWGLFDGPNPWGPWTTVAYGSELPDWTYSQDPNGASTGRPAYIHNFPEKWMSPDGVTLWQISDRGDQFNLVKATLQLVEKASFCRDGTCDANESCSICEADCGACPTQCSDSIDNDGDGKLDMADSGCSSISDDDESDCGDGVCEGGETCSDCASDCGACQSHLVSNLNAVSGKDYEIRYDGLTGEVLVYIDRGFVFTTVPSMLAGETYIKTANDDKTSTGSSFLSFDVNQSVSVYVAYDDRLVNIPLLLSSFVDTGEDLVTSDATFSLYEKDFPAGKVTLGGNRGNYTSSMYSVIVVPDNSPPVSNCDSDADSDRDGQVIISELINYISQWKSGSVTIGSLIDAIGKWKSGC